MLVIADFINAFMSDHVRVVDPMSQTTQLLLQASLAAPLLGQKAALSSMRGLSLMQLAGLHLQVSYSECLISFLLNANGSG